MPQHRSPRGLGDRYVGSHYDADEFEFLKAMELYKRFRPFPTWTEVLRVLKGLGYRKVESSLSPSPSKGEGTKPN
jgi:hypothetical protein